jgi:hypothetical protein
MNTSLGNGNGRTRLRRLHRWVGSTLLVFVVFLALSGIAVNHASDFGLDRKYISWPWLLEAYGVTGPAPYAGMISLGELVVVGDGQRVHLLLETGELIESIDLGASLPGDIVRVGSAGDRAILDSGGTLYRSDQEVTLFEPWAGIEDEIRWSTEVDPATAGLEVLQTAWRGEGLTVERVLLDLHSGRIFALPGRLLLDLVGIAMIMLSITGLVLSRVRARTGK